MWPNPLQYYLLPEMEETGDDFEELIDDEEGLEELIADFLINYLRILCIFLGHWMIEESFLSSDGSP
ncbi:unnamed protein product [Nippostrongylus brasiliensis]|uniref:Uncharacterized protein n=1 Tax=Nippostrongylus brasiliensis TaxID=27835 RepID=A0A0N4XRU8_NIPBR|nr:unnamed protein product [Nippostrongylus brasiliensis]